MHRWEFLSRNGPHEVVYEKVVTALMPVVQGTNLGRYPFPIVYRRIAGDERVPQGWGDVRQ